MPEDQVTDTESSSEVVATGTEPVTGSDDIADLQSLLTEMKLAPGQVKERLAASRKWEDRVKEKDPWIRELKDKAKQFDDLEESQKTELQKAADRATAAEAKYAEMESRTMRAEVAAAKGIPAALLSGTTQEELEASADALLAFRGEKPKPDFGGGDRGGDVKPATQLSKDDVSKLYKEKRYDEIAQARKDGRIFMGPPT